nr:MAG TPA: hypothetical protein [Caudoviricetes sp.]
MHSFYEWGILKCTMIVEGKGIRFRTWVRLPSGPRLKDARN